MSVIVSVFPLSLCVLSWRSPVPVQRCIVSRGVGPWTRMWWRARRYSRTTSTLPTPRVTSTPACTTRTQRTAGPLSPSPTWSLSGQPQTLGPWAQLEVEMRARMGDYCMGPAFVVTLPYLSECWMANRGAVPEYMWSAYCCPFENSSLPA